jgi:hypothetical protein
LPLVRYGEGIGVYLIDVLDGLATLSVPVRLSQTLVQMRQVSRYREGVGRCKAQILS